MIYRLLNVIKVLCLVSISFMCINFHEDLEANDPNKGVERSKYF